MEPSAPPAFDWSAIVAAGGTILAALIAVGGVILTARQAVASVMAPINAKREDEKKEQAATAAALQHEAFVRFYILLHTAIQFPSKPLAGRDERWRTAHLLSHYKGDEDNSPEIRRVFDFTARAWPQIGRVDPAHRKDLALMLARLETAAANFLNLFKRSGAIIEKYNAAARSNPQREEFEAAMIAFSGQFDSYNQAIQVVTGRLYDYFETLGLVHLEIERPAWT
jgi:hypothetical protein